VLGSLCPRKVHTNHKVLLGLLRKDDAHGQIGRWQVSLEEYDVESIHVPGKGNVLPHGMSWMRCAHEDSREGEVIGELNEVLVVQKEQMAEE